MRLSRHCSRSVFPFILCGLNYIKKSTELTSLGWEISFAVLLRPQICAIMIHGRRPWYIIILYLFMNIMLWDVLCPGFVEDALMVCQRVKDHDLNIICCSNCMFSKEGSLKTPLFCLSFSSCRYFSYIRYYGFFGLASRIVPHISLRKPFKMFRRCISHSFLADKADEQSIMSRKFMWHTKY